MSDNIKKPVDSLKYKQDKRAFIPTSELAGEESNAIKKQDEQAEYRNTVISRGQDPELFWLNKYANDDPDTQAGYLKVDTRSLYVHENINPESLINRLYSMKEDGGQEMSFFDNTDFYSIDPEQDVLDRVADYYKHSADWRNRLIQGDSLLVMNSLLQREGMAGKVQCMYFDPPYGIKYKSNWQMKLNKVNVSDCKDEDISGEPEMIKAYRDTWKDGIHSYLSYLRDRLLVARELLHESGSCFVQISDENVHLVRNIMDEIFGSDNFVSLITFRKKLMPLGNKLLEEMSNFIVWYAKDKNAVKYRQLYKKVIPNPKGRWTGISENGHLRRFTKEEKHNYALTLISKNVFGTVSQWAPSYSDSNVYEFDYEGKKYIPTKGQCWITTKEKMDKLGEMGRLFVEGDYPRYVMLHSDFPYAKMTSPWDDTAPAQDKEYVVQTSTEVIKRCILMTTDPGDLVLDPTCGSGTTAFVSEQWGRRWITIDTSRIALNIAKKRIMTALYPYYELYDKTDSQDIRQGFNYNKAPHITLKSLANDEPAEEETLYDQPIEDKKKIRVAGPFTVETLQSYNTQSPEEIDNPQNEANETRVFQERIFANLQSNGIRNGAKNEQAIFSRVEPFSNPFLHAKGYYKDNEGNEKLVYFHIGPKFGSVSKRSVTKAIQEFRNHLNEGASWLVVLGFSFEDSINEADYNLGDFQVSKVRMNDDLMQDGLLKKDKGAASFVIIGEPDIELIKDNSTDYHIEIKGLDIYDPIKDQVKARSIEDIAYWEVDDDYDGQQFNVHFIYFCGGDKKEFQAWRKGLDSVAPNKTKKKAQSTLKVEFNEELWDNLYGFKSDLISYKKGRKIAVRVISQFGEESSKIITMP